MVETTDRFEDRANAFLRYVADHGDMAIVDTFWGAYRCFDGHALACLVVGQHERARDLLKQTLEMMRANMSVEMSDPAREKWHLTDFALHPLLRSYRLFGTNRWPEWQALLDFLPAFRLHFGDLTENHNLLHLVIRYLFGAILPDTPFCDGRTGRDHRNAACPEIYRWANDWVRKGSKEWGSDIYYNVNLLAWFNLFDFSDEPAMRELAQSMIDLFLFDEAIDTFAGAFVGSARRAYGCYRTDPYQSPSRPLLYLYLGEPAGGKPMNLNFIGGVIQAATSGYRLSDAIRRIACCSEPSETKTTHTVAAFGGASHISRYTYRDQHAMLSVMNTPPGGGYGNEHVWQATLGEHAFVFVTHPTATVADGRDGRLSINAAMQVFEEPSPDPCRPTWTYANMPPSRWGDDVRPGWWQGNRCLPRSYGSSCCAMLIYNVPDDDPHPFVHLWFPRQAFSELREANGWTFGRLRDGYLGVWTSSPLRWAEKGLWSQIEARTEVGRVGIIARVGSTATHPGFDDFVRDCIDATVRWSPETLQLTYRGMLLDYAAGPQQNGPAREDRFARFETPWGSMPLGATQLTLRVQDAVYEIALPDIPPAGARAADIPSLRPTALQEPADAATTR